MKRVAVFGNAGGGKSTLAKHLAHLTRLPLYPLDLIQYRAGGSKIPHEEYLKAHAEILRQDEWIIDGFVRHGLVPKGVSLPADLARRVFRSDLFSQARARRGAAVLSV